MIHKAWCNTEKVPYYFSRSYIKFQGHTGWKIDDLDQIWARLLGGSQLSNPSDLSCCCKYGKHHPWHASLKYVQFLYRYNGTIPYPCYHMLWRQWRHRLRVEYSHKDQSMPIFVAIVLVWIATNQTIGTNVKKICLIIAKKMCHVTGTSVVLSAPSFFPSVDCKYTNWAL